MVAQAAEAKPSRAEAQTFTPANFGCRVLLYPRYSPGEHLEQDPANAKQPKTVAEPSGSAPKAASEAAAESQSNYTDQPAGEGQSNRANWLAKGRIEANTATAATLKTSRTWQQAETCLKQQGRATPAALSQSDRGHAPGAPKSQSLREPQLER